MMSFIREFFEERDGKSSMTRFAMFLLCVAAALVALSWCYVTIVLPEKLTTQITVGYGTVLAALVANGVVALYQRTNNPPTP